MKLSILFILFCASIFHFEAKAVEPQQKKIVVITESQKIDLLYQYLGSLVNIKFSRNGSYYSVNEAIGHLKMKQGKVGLGANTARKFIANVATKSSMSGLSYKIKYPDGKEMELSTVLTQRLLEIEAGK